jgi:murein DD-endopeptidase MepM/ murein hydrolase activator NlpD
MMRDRLAMILAAAVTLSGCTAIDEMNDGSMRASGSHPGYQVAAEPGETLDALAARFDLPPEAIIEANHLQPPYTLRPHQAVIIPPPATYRVHEGDSVEAIAVMLGVDEQALADANGLQRPYHMHVNQILRVPGGYGDGTLARDAGPITDPNLAYVPPGQPAVTPHSAISSTSLAPPPGVSSGFGAAAAQPQQPAPYQPPAYQHAPSQPPAYQPQPAALPQTMAPPSHYPASSNASVTALAPPPANRSAPQNAPTAIYPAQAGAAAASAPPPAQQPAPVQQAMAAPVPAGPAGAPHFIKPVGGDTIEGFGPDGSGQTNDGINIAAPAGTPVKAADAGTVIYTGNELAAFGNLVLIRHAGGWVTAYGHLASIGVQRGATVVQGQSIGTVGQTGSASTPQLHFEIRQGSKPVDPAPFLNARG